MPKPQRQHYISKFLIKQWAENGDVGVVCMYHRYSATVSYKKLHWVHSLSSPEQEAGWSRCIEDPAKLVLDGLVESLGPQTTDYEAARAFLSEPEHLEALIDLARLHYARSLPVSIRQLINSQGVADSAEAEAMIRERWDNTHDYHDHGAVITVLPAGSPYALGAVPVFDTQTWGPRDTVDARFMMPLTPRMMINGAMGLPPKQVEVVTEDIGHNLLLPMPMAGEPGLFPSQWMICQPSALRKITAAVLKHSEGRSTHWFALRDRIALCGDNATPEQQTNWQRVRERYEQNQSALETRALRKPVQNRIYETMVKDARELQADLDALDALVCGCSHHRHGEASSLWRRFMPQIICDEMPSRPSEHNS